MYGIFRGDWLGEPGKSGKRKDAFIRIRRNYIILVVLTPLVYSPHLNLSVVICAPQSFISCVVGQVALFCNVMSMFCNCNNVFATMCCNQCFCNNVSVHNL